MAESPTTDNIAVDWVFTADYALVDAQGKISILGIFDRLFAQTYPSVHAVLFLVIGYRGPAALTTITEVRFWSPAKDLVLTAQQQVMFGPNGAATGVLRLSPVPLPMEGDYIFEILAGTTSLKHVPISVSTVTNPS